MEAELTALAASGATTPVGPLVSETWIPVRFFARVGDEGSDEEELRGHKAGLTATRASRDRDAEADIEAGLRMRMCRELQADRQAADAWRQLLAKWGSSIGEDRLAVHNSISGGVQNGPVFQGQSFSGLTLGGSSIHSPQGEAGRSRE